MEPTDPTSPFAPAPVKPPVPFSVLAALEFRVGTIVVVEGVPESEKLMRLVVSRG